LLAAEVPACRLAPSPPTARRLGWNCWVRSRPFTQNARDGVFALNGA
jgi:hypothetical protein